MTRLVFLGTFLAAWFALDALVTSPPKLASATVALAASASVLVLGQRLLGVPWRQVPASLGLGRPVPAHRVQRDADHAQASSTSTCFLPR